MRHLLSNLILASAIPVAIMALAACSDVVVDNSALATAGNTVIEVLSETPQEIDEAGSRTAIDPTQYTSGQIGVNWLPSDKIGVYGDKGSGNIAFENQSKVETDATTFAGNLKDGEKPIYAYYPYNAAASDDPACLSGNLPLTQHFSTVTRQIEGDWKVGQPYEGASNRFRFKNIFAFFKFDINAAGTDVVGEKLLSVSLAIDGAQLAGDFSYNILTNECKFTENANADCVTMEWSDTPALSASTFNGYMSIAPCSGIKGKNIDIVITTDYHIVKFSQSCKVDALKANTYYTIPLELSRFADSWTIEDNPNAPREENAAWVPGLSSRLACANYVFAIPGKPFMHKIRVPQNSSQTEHFVVPVKTGVKRAYNLPEGLTWNAERCLVEGIAPAAGEYAYSVEFEFEGVTYKEGIKLVVSNDLHQPTPHMGWQSWNVLETKIDESSLKATADALVSNGLAEVGYIWLGIDDCWQNLSGTRDSNGWPQYNTSKFPNGLKALTDYIHSKGLKAGIYSDAGEITCASGSQAGGTTIGAYGYEAQTAAAFTAWGFDKLKEDWFWSGHGDNNGNLDPDSKDLARELYGKMGDGIKAAGNQILLSLCEWGDHEPWKWAAEVGASSWRMSSDHRDCWMGLKGTESSGWWNTTQIPNDPTTNNMGIGLKNTIDLMRYIWAYAGINRFHDADMLVVGIRGKGGSSSDLVYGAAGMNDYEYETEFAMWCMWGSPLLLTLDVRNWANVNEHDRKLLLNTDLIAINQDPLGQGAEFVKADGNLDYYMKDLANGDVAIAVVNLGDSSASFSISISDFEALDSSASYSAKNLISGDESATLSASSPLSGSLNSHATYIVRLAKK